MNIEQILLYLCLCILNNEIPEKSVLDNIDLQELYKCSFKHKVSAIVCYALEKVITPPEFFTEAKIKAIRKEMLLNAEFDKIVDFLENKGIYYMPLKGMVLKDFYPHMGTREMSDVDIYYDRAFSDDIKRYMLGNSYTCIAQTKSQDAYKREPVYNFEFHHLLFSQDDSDLFYDYYADINTKLVNQDANSLRYNMRHEDFYIYLIAHEYKHFSTYGTGIRSLLDVTVLLREIGSLLDWKYINSELKKLSLTEFEAKQKTLCEKLISSGWEDNLTTEESAFLAYFLSSGAYGDFSTGIVNKLTGQTCVKDIKITTGMKIRYIFRRVFPSVEYYRAAYPFFYKHKVLIPVCVIYRVFLAVFRKNEFVKSELKILSKK